MRFSNEVIDYLRGDKFSSGLTVPITDPKTKLFNRIDLITHLCLKKRIIHLGFADHLELIKPKIEKNTWLHQRILQVAEKCIGIDINLEAVEYIKNNLHVEDIYVYDVSLSDPLEIIINEEWDYMVLGEIIEHINNPVSFLQDIFKKYRSSVKGIILTAPNAFRYYNVKTFLRKTEYINSDHRFWFTPYTLAKIGTAAGWTPIRFEYADSTNYPLRYLIKLFPVLSDSIVMVFH